MTFLLVCFLLTMYYVLRGEDLHDIIFYMKQANAAYWFVGVLLVIGFIFSEALIINYLLRTLDIKAKFINCCYYSFIGYFVSCITPSASGGQPAQALLMKKTGIPYHLSTVVLLVVTISYKLVLIIYGALVIIFRPAEIMKYMEGSMAWVYLGMFLNILIVGFMLLLAFKPMITKHMVMGIISIIGRIWKSPRVEAYGKKVSISMDNFVIKSEYLFTHKKAMGTTLAITFAQRTLLFLITYLVCLSFNSNGVGLVNTTVIQGLISVAVDMLPLPGGMGISEHLFLTVFENILEPRVNVPAMIVSRGLSYYTQLLISAIMSGIAYIKFFGIENWKEEK